MNKKYNNNQIKEAICEFRFVPDQNWDFTIPGLFYSKVGKKFPKKKELKHLGFTISTSGTGIDSQINQGLNRIQFISNDESQILQIGENLLTISILRPYSNWEEFKKNIIETLNDYKEIVDNPKINRIGLRYINHFLNFFPKDGYFIQDYFDYFAELPEKVTKSISSSYISNIFDIIDESNNNLLGTVNLVFSLNSDEKLNENVILDIDFFGQFEKAKSIEEGLKFVDIAHENIIRIFENSITDKTKKMID